MTPIEELDNDPTTARLFRRLAALGRVLHLDKRGVGLSDPISLVDPPTLEAWVDDLVAVMDAAQFDQAAVVGVLEDAHAAMLLAALHPERVRALVLVNAGARFLRSPDYPIGLDTEFAARLLAAIDPQPGAGALDLLALGSPARMHDERFLEWFARAGRRGASPATARVLVQRAIEADLRSMLPAIGAPTLVLHRLEHTIPPPEHGRYLAAHIPNARYVELPGSGSVIAYGDVDPVLDEIEEFLTGALVGIEPDREVLTILFTDIVGSTARAAEVGDRRWRELIDEHDTMVGRTVERFGGREIKTTGDGVIATFRAPTPAIRCAQAVRAEVHSLGFALRAGIHIGEVDVRGSDIGGIAVNIASRIAALALANEILVSRTVKDLLTGTSIELADRGAYALKGVPGTWELFALAPTT